MHAPPVVRRAAVAAGFGVATTGMLAGVLLLGALAASILLAVVFALVWPLAAVIRQVADEAPYRSPVMVAAAAAAGVLCLPGLVRLLAWGGAGIAVALVVAVVFVMIDLVAGLWVPRRTSKYSKQLARLTEARFQDDERLIASLQCPLSLEELCGVWAETATTLARDAGPRDRQAVAEVRRICLDEFERRNPDGFQRWLAAGAPANPSTYFLSTPGE